MSADGPREAHDESHEDRLRKAMESSEPTQMFEELGGLGCSQCVADFEEMQRAKQILEDMANHERDEFSTYKTSMDEAFEQRVIDRVRPLVWELNQPQSPPGPAWKRWMPTMMVGFAAIVLLAIVLWPYIVGSSEPGPLDLLPEGEGKFLSPEDARLVPSGVVGDISKLSWNLGLPDGTRYLVRVAWDDQNQSQVVETSEFDIPEDWKLSGTVHWEVHVLSNSAGGSATETTYYSTKVTIDPQSVNSQSVNSQSVNSQSVNSQSVNSSGGAETSSPQGPESQEQEEEPPPRESPNPPTPTRGDTSEDSPPSDETSAILEDALSAYGSASSHEYVNLWEDIRESLLSGMERGPEDAQAIYAFLNQLRGSRAFHQTPLMQGEVLEFAFEAAVAAGREASAAYSTWKWARWNAERGHWRESWEAIHQYLDLEFEPNYHESLLFEHRAEVAIELGFFAKARESILRCDERIALLTEEGRRRARRDRLPALWAQYYLAHGTPDRAFAHVQDALDRAAELRLAGVQRAADICQAYLVNLWFLRAVADYQTGRRQVEEYLADDELMTMNPQAAHKLRLELARCLIYPSDPSDQEVIAAREQLESLVQAEDVFGSDRLDMGLCLARIEVDTGRFEEAFQRINSWRTLHPSLEQIEPNLRQRLAIDTLRSVCAREANTEDPETVFASLEQVGEELLGSWQSARQMETGVGFLTYQSRTELFSQLFLLAPSLENGMERAFAMYCRSEELGTILERVRKAELDEETSTSTCDGLLVFVTGATSSHVLAIDDKITSAIIPPRVAARELALLYVDHLRRSQDASLGRFQTAAQREREIAREVARAFLPDEIESRLRNWSTMNVVGLETLASLPIAWLILSDGERLLQKLSVNYVPSTLLTPHLELAARQWGEQRLDWESFLIGGSIPSEFSHSLTPLSPLRVDQEDASALQDAYVPGESTAQMAFLNEEAKESSLYAWSGKRVGLLQILAHSVNDLGKTTNTLGFLVAPTPDHDGVIWAQECERLPRSHCALLTSCRSGAGAERRGDANAEDLVGTFLMAGTPTVIVNNQDIRFDVALACSKVIRRKLAAGESPAGSLRAAQLQFLSQYPDEAPFLIGSMRVVGAGHISLKDPKGEFGTWRPMLAGLIVVCAILALWQLRPQRLTASLS